MKSILYILCIIACACALGACAKDTAEEASAEAVPSPAPSAAPGASNPAPSSPAPAAADSASARPAAPKATAKPADPAPAAPAKPAAPRTTVVPEGTEVAVLLIDSISTGKNKAGDQFMASLADPIMVNGQTVVDRGVKVQGRIVDAEGSGRVSGKANIRMVLTSIVDGGKTYPIVTRPFVAEAETTKGRDAGIIGGGAGLGAAIGAIAGGKSGAAKGAAIGGAAGTGGVLATKGKEVEFDSETKLKFTLQESADLPKIGS